MSDLQQNNGPIIVQYILTDNESEAERIRTVNNRSRQSMSRVPRSSQISPSNNIDLTSVYCRDVQRFIASRERESSPNRLTTTRGSIYVFGRRPPTLPQRQSFVSKISNIQRNSQIRRHGYPSKFLPGRFRPESNNMYETESAEETELSNPEDGNSESSEEVEIVESLYEVIRMPNLSDQDLSTLDEFSDDEDEDKKADYTIDDQSPERYLFSPILEEENGSEISNYVWTGVVESFDSIIKYSGESCAVEAESIRYMIDYDDIIETDTEREESDYNEDTQSIC